MANNGGKINFQVGFSVDKSGLSEMQSLFQQIANKAAEPGNKMNTGLQQAAKTASTLDNILTKTFNTDLGSLNVTKFNQELSKSGLSLKDVKAQLSQAGNQGVTAFNRLSQAILGTNQQIRQSSKALDSLFTTFKNTIRYGISSSVFNNMANSIQRAFDYSKQLDTSLNDIRIVTDKSAENMADFAKQANEAAKGMGASTLDYTNAALIYYQQGLSDAEVAARAETTIKAANVTGQAGEEVSEQLTAVWNGYKVTAEETELYVDKLAAVAATTAADLEELSTGMSKVASAANAMGVDFDDLNAQIATIVSVTRQAPESVGTALKTIYARLGDLKVDGVDEFGVSLGEVSEQMVQMGIQILDQNGDLRDMSSVIAEVAEKWNGWTQAQRQAAAVAMAGKRQYNNLIALFDNWDMYTEALNTSTEAVGTLQHQQDIYMESTAAKLKTLKAAWQGLYDDAINEDEINAGIEALTNLVEVFDNFIDSFGGGIKSIGGFGAIISSIFNKQIADSINAANQRMSVFQQNVNLLQTKSENISLGAGELDSRATVSQLGAAANTEKQLEIAKEIYNVRAGLNQQQAESLIKEQQETGNLVEQKTVIEQTILTKEKQFLTEGQIQKLLNVDLSTLEDINGAYGLQTELNKESLEIEQQSINTISKIVDEYTNAAKAKKAILEESQQIVFLDQDELKNLLKQNTNMESLQAAREKIVSLLQSAHNASEKAVQEQEREAAAVNRIYEGKSKIYDLDIQIQNKEIEINQLLEQGAQGQRISQQVTTITSALGNMAMAWSSVNSLIETWNNDQASFGDKITQTFMTLGMTLPIVISNFIKLNEIFGITNSLSAIFSANKAKELILIQRANTVKEIENAMLAREAKLRGVTVAELNADIKASIQDAVAKDAQAIATRRAATMQQRLNLAMASNPIGLVITALTALIGVIAAVSQHYEKLRTEANEAAEAARQSADSYKQEVASHNELISNYEDLIEQYKSGQIEKEKLWDTTNQLIDIYDLESDRLAVLAGDYNAITTAIKEKQKAEQEELLNRQQESVTSELKNAAQQGTISDPMYQMGNNYKIAFQPDQDIGSYVNREELQEKINEIFGENFARLQGEEGLLFDIFSFDKEDPQQIRQAINNLQKLKQILEESGAASTQFASDVDDVLQALNTEGSLDTLAEYDTEILNTLLETSDLEGAETESEFNEILNKIKEHIQEQIDKGFLSSNINIDDEIANILMQINNSFAKQKIIDTEISKKFGNDIDETLLAAFHNYDTDTQTALLQLGFDFDKETGKKDLKNYIQYLTGNQNGIYSIPVSFQNQINDTVLKGKDIAKADWETMQSTLSPQANELLGDREEFNNKSIGERIALLQQVNELTKQNNLLAIQQYDENKKASEEIIKNLKSQEELLLERAKRQQELINRASSKEEQEHRIAELKEIQSQLEEITNKKYEIQISLDIDVATDNLVQSLVGDVMTEADQIKTAAESIGEGWKVAAEDVSTFAAAFPELMEGMERLEDGSLQLNKEIVNNALEASQAEINANKKVAIEAAETKIKQLKLELQFKEQQEVILTEALEGNKTAEETKQALADATFNYQTQLLDNGLIAEADALTKAQIQEQAGVNGMINILGGLNEAINTIHHNFANMLTPDGEMLSLDAVAGSVKQITSSSVDTTKLKNNGFDTSDIDAMIDARNKLQQEQSQIKTQIASYEGFVSEMMNSVSEMDKAADRVQSGLAGKEDKSKSSSSKDKDKELKKLEEEFDRYWDINKALDLIDRNLKKIDKDQENLYGKELIRSLKQENELLANQSQLYEQLYAAQQQEAAELRGTLANSGVIFDASGAVLNYAEATAAALKEYNDAITAYNAGLLDDAALKIHEQKFEQFKKDLERYDTLFYTEMQDTMDKIDDLRRQTLANNLKAWEVEIQLKLDFKELEREWNDFIKEVNNDFKSVFKDLRVDMKSMLTDAKTYIGDEGTINTIIGAVHDTTAEIDKMMGGGSSDMYESVSQAQEKLKELNEELLDSATALYDLWEEAWDNYLEGIDQVSDAFDDLIERFERINDELEFQEQIIELLYGDEAYALMNKLYEGQERNTFVQLQSLKTQVDMWKDLFYTSGATLDNQTSWTQDQQKYYEQWMEAQSALNDLVIDYIELLKKDYLNTVSSVLQELEKYVTGSSLDDLNTQWERISDNADKYYDSVEGAYYIQTLANKIDESIANSNNLQAQQKLMKLREKEIGYLREKENLTEYDIKAAEMRYEIALKEIALQEAQNNKTGMKLTRNEQGNWSYQYIADEDDIMSRQQELLDAYNNLYQLASNAYEANLEALTELQEKYLESAKAIYEDDTLSNEEREKKLLELREWYLEQYALLSEENQLYRNDLAASGAGLLLEIYKQDEEAYESMTDNERQLVDALIDANISDYEELDDVIKGNYDDVNDKAKETYQEIQNKAREVMADTRQDWTSGAQTIADLWNKDGGASVKTQVTKAYEQIEKANQQYQNAVDECAKAVERDFTEEGIMGAIQRAENETDNLKDKTIELVNESIPYLAALKEYVDQIEAAWRSVQQAIMDAISLIDEYLRKVGEANAAAQQQAEIAQQQAAAQQAAAQASSESKQRTYNPSTNSSSSYTDPYGASGTRRYSDGTIWGITDYDPTYNLNYVTLPEKKKKMAGGNYTNYMQAYASGGYTGEWNNSGKLAILHEKELVLNADDTKNFLSAVNTIRALNSSVGGSIQDAVLKAVANTALSLGSIKTNGVMGNIANNNSSTDNVFNITAEFPNANSVDDIREAILSLPNIASQYVNSTLK